MTVVQINENTFLEIESESVRNPYDVSIVAKIVTIKSAWQRGAIGEPVEIPISDEMWEFI